MPARSRTEVHGATRSLIGHNPGARHAEHAAGKRGKKGVSAAVADEVEEARIVVDWVARMTRTGTVPARIAILYRQPIQARPFEEALVRAGALRRKTAAAQLC